MRLRNPSGSLSQFTQEKNGRTYPAVSGDRDHNNPDHWFWVYTYKTPHDGKTHSKSVPRSLVPAVRSAILDRLEISQVLETLGKSISD
jgi:hypothetical protein